MSEEKTHLIQTSATEEPDVCTRQQINQCLMDIQDNHPLRSRAKFDHIVPALSCFRMCFKAKQDFNHALRKTLLQEMKIKMPKSDTELVEKPFLILGYGVNAYFDIMLSLVWMFSAITIFTIPLFYAYSQNDTKGLQGFSKYAITQYSLGNMGGSSVSCASKKLAQTEIYLECYIGQMDDTNYKFGVMPNDMGNSIYCTEEAMWNETDNANKYHCTDVLDQDKMMTQLKNKCSGQKNCTIDISNWWVAGTDTTLVDSTSEAATCGMDATFFLQGACTIEPTQASMRKIFGLVSGCLSVFVYLFVIIYFDYVKSVQKCKFLDQDVNTITAGDYSVEFDLEESTYNNFLAKYHDKQNPMTENAQFKLYIQDELEKRINELPDQGYDEPEIRHLPKKIAQITFAYENTQIINWLKYRGTYIKNEKWDKVKKVEKQIIDGITNTKSSKLLNQLQLPCSVFVTFESEEGNNRAIIYNDKSNPQMDFLGEQIEIQDASEPTDIIWENRQYGEMGRNIKRVIVWTIIIIMLCISAAIIYKFTLISLSAKFMFPPANCAKTLEEFQLATDDFNIKNVDTKNKTLEEMWVKPALLEYKVNSPLADAGKPTHYKDTLQCFCKELKHINPLAKSADVFTAQIPENGKIVAYSQPICDIYKSQMIHGKIFGQGVAFVIIAVNLILKALIIALITWVKEDTVSQQLSSITNGVFIAQFFNTGFLLLLVNANMTEHEPTALTQYFKGPFYDYMPRWYIEVGMKIVQTMMINSILPYVGLVTAFLIPEIKRALDRKFSKDIYKTKKTSMAMYKVLYSGANYVIHFKYSGILNITFITMMYGVGMPILFPLAAFNFFNQWLCERIIVAYCCQQPPIMDDKLTKNCIEMMYFSPLFLLINGYWMLSNPQIFSNQWKFIGDSEHQMLSEHFLSFSVGHATPMLIMAFSAVFIIAFTKIFSEKLGEWGFALQSKEIQVDEDLPNFFKTIRLNQADEIVLEEKNMMEYYELQINDPDTVEKLDQTTMPKKAMMGTPWYTVLSNSKYQNDFNYIGAFTSEREKLIEDGLADDEVNGEMTERSRRVKCSQSDMVMVLLNLAVIPDEVVKKLDFDEGWQGRFKDNMKAYKDGWNGKFKYQDADLEEKYLAFKANAEAHDQDYAKEKERVEQLRLYSGKSNDNFKREKSVEMSKIN